MRWAPLLAVLLVACGGAAAPVASPSSSPSPAKATAPSTLEAPPSTIDEAQAQIARARATLEPQADQAGVQQQSLDPQSSQCGDACRAVQSMRRAVDALCGLAGDADDRCKDARATLTRCEGRVAACGC